MLGFSAFSEAPFSSQVAASGDIIVNLEGLAASGEAGGVTVSAGANVSAFGVSSLGRVGAMDAFGNTVVDIVGVEASGVAGQAVIIGNSTLDLTGVSGTGEVESVEARAGADVEVTSPAMNGVAGQITALAGTGVVVNLTGVQADALVGEVQVWGRIVPDPGTGYTPIDPSSSPNWSEVEPSSSTDWSDIAA